MIIGILGPSSSYSEKAAKKWIREIKIFSEHTIDDETSLIKYHDSISDTIIAVDGGLVDIGIVPIENSIHGSVRVTLDMLLEKDITIKEEIVIPIKHILMSKGKISDIEIISSHPQALAQCRLFLQDKFKNVKIVVTDSTSDAAKQASKHKEIAAIASIESAIKYNLSVLMENIQDNKENYTRFVVLSKPSFKLNKTLKFSENGEFKTSIIVYLKKDKPGALYKFIGIFAKRNINLTKIESRPSKREIGDYLFYIDFIGNIEDAIVKEVIKDISSKARMIKILGSYPIYSTNLN
ncbi:MAG: prephenate dehydratase [Methanosarcinales archaeon]|nr:prephenate dehydratase [Methanosarcinales archaeon]